MQLRSLGRCGMKLPVSATSHNEVSYRVAVTTAAQSLTAVLERGKRRVLLFIRCRHTRTIPRHYEAPKIDPPTLVQVDKASGAKLSLRNCRITDSYVSPLSTTPLQSWTFHFVH